MFEFWVKIIEMLIEPNNNIYKRKVVKPNRDNSIKNENWKPKKDESLLILECFKINLSYVSKHSEVPHIRMEHYFMRKEFEHKEEIKLGEIDGYEILVVDDTNGKYKLLERCNNSKGEKSFFMDVPGYTHQLDPNSLAEI